MIIVNARFLTQTLTGVQRYAIEISLQLKKLAGDEVCFVAPRNIIHQSIAEQLEVEKVGTHTGHLWDQLDLPMFLKKKGFPLLLCLCNTAPICYRNKIVVIHDVAYKVYPQTYSKSFLWFYRFMIPKIIHTSRHLITVSEFSKQELIKYYRIKEDKLTVVYNAVSGLFCKKDDSEQTLVPYLLAVSSLNYRKNFLAVLKAFQIFESNDQNTFLYIIGDLKNKNFNGLNIESYKRNKRIKFLGRVSDAELVKYYRNAIGFVYPSLYEGFGIPPLEAQNCACPVLCADIPPLREVFGDSAIYCNPFSVEDIAKKMHMLASGEKNALIERGNHNIMRYSWEKSAIKMLEVVNEYKLY